MLLYTITLILVSLLVASAQWMDPYLMGMPPPPPPPRRRHHHHHHGYGYGYGMGGMYGMDGMYGMGGYYPYYGKIGNSLLFSIM
ncbi:unnamed protein product [Heligmosomoides polygyrus]|uniref:Uncharacterized protein n=1 Tax=Heligmosomoides polygyrus TaxID=6339 RepID=A0A183FKN8_HELPZ|nr:unnamed protein product [Heligmosomoides polygyrus]